MTEIKKAIQTEGTKSARIKILKQKCEYLYKVGKPFKLIKSGTTYELQSGYWNEKAHSGGFSTKDMTFIKSVKQYIEKHGIAVNFIDRDYKAEKIEYIKVGKFKAGQKVENLIYIDANYAYWQTAYNLGIISQGLYKRGINEDVSKVVRLAALGSLAKTKSVWDFDGKDFKREALIHSHTTENLWYAICKTVGDIMLEISKKIGKDFVFYWVDGIYIRDNHESLKVVLDTFKKYNYTTKIGTIPWVEFGEKGFTVQGAMDVDVKHFHYSLVPGKKSQTISDYLENQRLLKVANNIRPKK